MAHGTWHAVGSTGAAAQGRHQISQLCMPCTRLNFFPHVRLVCTTQASKARRKGKTLKRAHGRCCVVLLRLAGAVLWQHRLAELSGKRGPE